VSLAVHAAFCAALRRREAAIALALSNLANGSFQPGLFDRRADQEHLSRALNRQDLVDDTMRRVAAVDRAAAIDLTLGRTSLVIVP
jgi:hypothetical protein